jgi:hypothetical protein
MRKGLLAWWRRRIVARGLAGAALFAVPVVVAALIGFGTSLSGVAGGLSAVTTGPDAAPASQSAPSGLNNAVVALAARSGNAGVPGQSGNGSAGQVTPGTSGTGTVNGTGTQSGSTGGGSSGPLSPITGGGDGPLSLPGGSGGGDSGPGQDAVNGVGSGVNNVIGGVNNTLDGLLGR